MFELIKAIGGFVIPLGAEVISSSITAWAVRDCGRGMKLAAGVSSLAIGWWIGDKAADYFDDEIDNLKEKWEKFKLGGNDEA